MTIIILDSNVKIAFIEHPSKIESVGFLKFNEDTQEVPQS